MIGNVIDKKGSPAGNQYTIRDSEGIEYFAHVGDLTANENLVYQNPHRGDLNKGDLVEFDPIDERPRAIHVRKVIS